MIETFLSLKKIFSFEQFICYFTTDHLILYQYFGDIFSLDSFKDYYSPWKDLFN